MAKNNTSHTGTDDTSSDRQSLKPGRGGDKASLAVALGLLSILLVIIFFFAVNQALHGIEDRISGLEESIRDLQARVMTVENPEYAPGTADASANEQDAMAGQSDEQACKPLAILEFGWRKGAFSDR